MDWIQRKTIRRRLFLLAVGLLFLVSRASALSQKRISLQALAKDSVSATLYLPDPPAPKKGFPLVIGEMPKGAALFFAQHGFAVAEVHSIVQRLRSLYSPDEEVLSFYKQLLEKAEKATAVNRRKIGVIGGSGGGIFSYKLCGLVRLAASVPMAAPYDAFELLYPNHTIMLAKGLALLGIIRAVSMMGQPVYIRKYAKKNSDSIGKLLITGAVHDFHQEGFTTLSPRFYLKQNRCPSLIINSWHDFFMGFDPAWKNYLEIHAKKRLLVSEGAHGSEIRPEEMAFQFSKAFLWLERYLQDRGNGIEKEPPFLFSLPASQNAFRENEMEHFYFTRFPPEEEKKLRLYLSPSGKLRKKGSSSKRVEETTVQNGFQRAFSEDPEEFLLDMVFQLLPSELTNKLPDRETLRRNPLFKGFVTVFGKFLKPLQKKLHVLPILKEETVQKAYTSAPLKEEMLILGAPEATVEIRPKQSSFQLHLLLFDLAPDGKKRQITRGSYTEERIRSLKPQRLRLRLESIFYRVRKGHALQVVIASTDFPTALPLFQAFSFSLLEGGNRSFLVLPFLKQSFAPPQPVKKVLLARRGKYPYIQWAKPREKVRGFFIYAKDEPIKILGKEGKEEAGRKEMKEILEALGRDKFRFAHGFRQIGFVPYPKTEFVLRKREARNILAVSALSLSGKEGLLTEVSP